METLTQVQNSTLLNYTEPLKKERLAEGNSTPSVSHTHRGLIQKNTFSKFENLMALIMPHVGWTFLASEYVKNIKRA